MPKAIADPSTSSLAQCKATMKQAFSEFMEHRGNATQSAIALGNAAIAAKDQLPHTEFVPWIEKNFKFSPQWVRVCMRAAETWNESRKKILPYEVTLAVMRANTAEKLAALRPEVTGKPPKQRPKKVAPVPEEEVEVIDAPTFEDREAALIAREQACDAREAWLDKREAALDEREARLATLEEGKPLPAATLDAGKKTPRAGKAPRKAGKGSRRLDQPPPGTVGSPDASNASEAF
jgi:hypothetical protein